MANNSRLDGMRVAILVADDFKQAELTEPRKALDQAGAATMIIAPHPGKVQGMNHDEKTDRFNVDQTLEQANADDYDAVLLPGGVINADALRMEPKAQEFVKRRVISHFFTSHSALAHPRYGFSASFVAARAASTSRLKRV